LCASLGSADYIEIAREFSTVIMAEIPKLSAENATSQAFYDFD